MLDDPPAGGLAQEPAEAVAPAGSGDVRLLQLLNGFSGERARAAEVVVCEAQEVAHRRPETARRRSCLRIRVVEDDVLVRARLGLLVSARGLPRLESGRRQIQRLEHAGANRRRERRLASASDCGANEPEADVAVGKELTRSDRQPRGLALGYPLQPALTTAELLERRGPFAGEPALVGEQLADRRLDPRARRRLVEREQPVLGERQRERRRERLRDRRDPKGGLG